jgi:hypothetical protein
MWSSRIKSLRWLNCGPLRKAASPRSFGPEDFPFTRREIISCHAATSKIQSREIKPRKSNRRRLRPLYSGGHSRPSARELFQMIRLPNLREFYLCEWSARPGQAVARAQVLGIAMLSVAVAIQAQAIDTAKVVQGIENAQRYKEQCLAGLTATEHYVVKNSHFNEPALMTVHVSYTRGAGKTYKVVSRSGPGLLQKRVLDRLLEEESAMTRGTERERSLLNTANYSIELTGSEQIAGRQCYVLSLVPKSRSIHLLKGRAWIDSTTFALVRIEGRPTASPSFWTGKPLIVRDYIPVQGFWLAQHSHATSDGFFAGNTQLDVQYTEYSVSPDTRTSAASFCEAPDKRAVSSLRAEIAPR